MASLQLLLCCATTLLIANALELTPRVFSAAVNEASASGKAKTQYTPFPLLEDDVEVEPVELPLDVDQEENLEQMAHSHHGMPPAWLQFIDEPAQKPKSSSKSSFMKLPANGPQHKHATGHAHGACTIEITSKVPGVCQPMGKGMGSACISGDFMEVYSASHCTNY